MKGKVSSRAYAKRNTTMVYQILTFSQIVTTIINSYGLKLDLWFDSSKLIFVFSSKAFQNNKIGRYVCMIDVNVIDHTI